MRPINEIICLDFETFYSDEFTLKKLTTEAYIRDPQFEALLCGFRRGDGSTCWVGQEDLPAYLASIDWETTGVVAHHAHFDGLILGHHYGVKPALWFDTLSMARAIHGNHLSVALASLAKQYELEPKSVPYDLFKGRRWANLDTATRQTLGVGCVHDVELTWEIFSRMASLFPLEEYDIVDMTVRMFTEPALVGDVEMLNQVVVTERTRKYEIMNKLGVTEKDLQSADKFTALLEDLGVDVEMKTTAAGNSVPAIAKTDQFMKDLLEDADETVATLAQARLDVRSTISETRAGRLADMATRGAMPVYLAFCAAHTIRWGGGDKVNWQNPPRGSDIQKAIMAPPGCKLVNGDLSQIECRMLVWFADQQDAIEDFRLGKDPYIGVASIFYGRPITKADKAERGTGKQLRLSCGYGAGAETIRKTAARGTYGPPVEMSDADALRARDVYRNTHPMVVKSWRWAENLLKAIYANKTGSFEYPAPNGKLVFEVNQGRVTLPNGLWLNYSTLDKNDTGDWIIKSRSGWVKTYGGKIIQNFMEGLCRIVMSQAMRVLKSYGIRVALTKHDELLAVVPDALAQQVYDVMIETMTRPVAWAPGLPLAAEGGISDRYEK